MFVISIYVICEDLFQLEKHILTNREDKNNPYNEDNFKSYKIRKCKKKKNNDIK